MNASTNRVKWALTFTFLLTAILAGIVFAANVSIDSFDQGTQVNCMPQDFIACFAPEYSVNDNGTSLGGERDVEVIRTSGLGYINSRSDAPNTTNYLSVTQDDATVGAVIVTWDGNDNDALSLNTSLLNLDLTGGGTNNQFVLTTLFADLGNTITIDVYCSATDFSRGTATIPAGITDSGNRVDVHVPFSSFVVQGGAGCQPADTGTTNARAVQVHITGVAGADLTLDLIETSGGRDYGDLPDGAGGTTNYSVAIRNANHIAQGLRLGTNVDSEVGDSPNSNSLGDDTVKSPDDEDGILRSHATFWTPGASVNLLVSVKGCTGTCYLNGWIDWNKDGDFDDTNETVFTDSSITNGDSQTRSITVDNSGAYTTGNDVYARFRICPSAGACNTTTATDVVNGEVEDYYWQFDPSAISLANMVAGQNTNHLVIAGICLFALINLGVMVYRRWRLVHVR